MLVTSYEKKDKLRTQVSSDTTVCTVIVKTQFHVATK